jgi:hypothetical protein
MPFQKGHAANPLGRGVEKPFADALRLEIAAVGPDQRALRAIARNLLRMAQNQRGTTALPAVLALADRLDGRPSQESMVTVVKRDASDWSRDELVAFLQDAASLQQLEVKTIDAQPIETVREQDEEKS